MCVGVSQSKSLSFGHFSSSTILSKLWILSSALEVLKKKWRPKEGPESWPSNRTGLQIEHTRPRVGWGGASGKSVKLKSC